MSLFSKILDKLGLRKEKEQEQPATTGTVGSTPKPTATASAPKPAPTATPTAKPTTTTTPAASTSPKPAPVSAREEADNISKEKPVVAAPKPMSQVDVMTMLEQKAKGTGLNWKQSISDLLFLLEIDNSRAAREELAKELGAPADVMSDNVRMNTWLHKEVLRKIAENGGNIPQELLD